MSILEKIKQQKLKEVTLSKAKIPISQLEQSEYFARTPISLKEKLLKTDSSGIIAEFKRKSPSKGNINIDADVELVTKGYADAGAAALSVLTDEQFFGAQKEDFSIARKTNRIPMLRKDFIIDEYQVLETKAMGADVLLLIAKILSPKEIENLSKLAQSLGLEVLLETHTEQEILDNEKAKVDFFGINNRDLNSFETNIENSIKLAALLPENVLKIAESGIQSAKTVEMLRKNGFNGFLMGEYFMRNQYPQQKCAEFIAELDFLKLKK